MMTDNDLQAKGVSAQGARTKVCFLIFSECIDPIVLTGMHDSS